MRATRSFADPLTTPAPKAKGNRDPRVTTIVELVERQPQHGWTVSELAESVHLSPSRLRHLFLANLGIPPSDYLRHQRLVEAERLLRTSHRKVKDIMHQVGFSDSSHFSRDFAAQFGVSPSAYRRSKFLKSS